jgi:hypothetical protein
LRTWFIEALSRVTTADLAGNSAKVNILLPDVTNRSSQP